MTDREITIAATYVFGKVSRRQVGITATAPHVDAVLRLACYWRCKVGAHVIKPRDPERAAVGALNEVFREFCTGGKFWPEDPIEQRELREAFAAGFYGQAFAVAGVNWDGERSDQMADRLAQQE